MPALALPDGQSLSWREWGEGPALLLLHGFTGASQAWGGLADELARDHRVIAPDLPGHGGSSGSREPRRFALERVVSDLVELLDHTDVERAVWIGYSMGGRIALGAAGLRPQRVRALVLEGASPGLEHEGERTARRGSDEALARRLETQPLADFVDAWMAQPLFRTQARLAASSLQQERERRLRNDPRWLAACLRGLGTGVQPSLWSALPKLECPALLIAGEHDAKFRELGQRMAQRLPRACLRTVAAAGHTTHLEAPDGWLTSVRAFLDQLESAEGADE